MKVYLLLEDAEDPFYKPHPMGVFSSESKADSENPVSRFSGLKKYDLVELELDAPIVEQEESIYRQLRAQNE